MPPTLTQLRNRNLSIITHTVKIYGHVTAPLTQEQASTWRDQNDAPHGWTPLEVLGHIVDADAMFYQRAVMILEQNNPPLPYFPHEQLVIERAYNQQAVQAVYARLVESRARFVHFFEQLADDQWERTGVHPERGTFSLWDALMQVSTHDTRHLEQLTRIIAEATP